MPLRVEPRRDRKLNRLVKAAPAVELARGDLVYDAGAPADAVILVRSGHIRLLQRNDPTGRGGRTVGLAGPWELTGEEALLPDRCRLRTAVAGEACRVQRMDGARVASVLRSSQASFGAFTASLTEDVRVLRDLVTGSGGPATPRRLAMLLLDLARRLGQPAGKGAVVLTVRPTHRTLADLCGAHRSTVTTLLNEWLYEGILGSRERRLVVLRPAHLRALAQGEETSP